MQELSSFAINTTKIVSECDQEIPQSQTADNPMAPRSIRSNILNFNKIVTDMNIDSNMPYS